MPTRPTSKLSSLAIPPLMLGIGIGIGAVGSASAATVTSAVSNALKTAASSVQCATTPTACLSVTNTVKNGVAILGASQNGLGIEGTSMSSVGVTGASQYSNGLNGKSVTGFGVHGTSTVSNGVVGTTNGTGNGVLGTATAVGGVGVQASSVGTALAASVTNPPGNYDFNPAVTISAPIPGGGVQITSGDLTTREPSSQPAIVTADTSQSVLTSIGNSADALSAVNTLEFNSGGYGSPGDGIMGSSTFGNGVVGSTNATSINSQGAPVAAMSATASNGADLYLGFGNGTFEVTNDGSVNASGTVTSGVTCAPATCGNSVKLTTYATRNASPTMEDFGRAQMVNGAATIRFDATFAGTIDATKDYHVFLTPEGDNRGLFVARRTSAGFIVGESLGGHSTLAFSYRIVASPYGSTAPRLPVIRTQRFAAAAFAQGQRSVKAMRHTAAQMRSQIEK